MPSLIFLSLLLSIVMTSTATFVSEKQFTKQVESKLSVDHLIFLAYCDLREILGSEIVNNGMLTYEKGIVLYQVVNTTEETVKVQLNASNETNGKSQVTFVYNYMLGEMIDWVEMKS